MILPRTEAVGVDPQLCELNLRPTCKFWSVIQVTIQFTLFSLHCAFGLTGGRADLGPGFAGQGCDPSTSVIQLERSIVSMWNEHNL